MPHKFTFFLLVFCTVSGRLWAHDIHGDHYVGYSFHLKSKNYFKGCVLFFSNDSVYFQTEAGSVKGYLISEFDDQDKTLLLERKKLIDHVNQSLVLKQHKAEQKKENKFSFFPVIFVMIAIVLLFILNSIFNHRKRKWIVVSTSLLFLSSLLIFSFRHECKLVFLGTDPLFIEAAFTPFKPEVLTRWDNTWFYVESKGIPKTHSMMTGIRSWQQQVPIPQCYTGSNAWQIPLQPELAVDPVPVSPQHFLRGAVAIASNGVPIFNPYTNTGVDALLDGQLDRWGGHSGRADDYHYHVAPMFLDTQTVDILPIAFALDGFPVYASREPDGSSMKPLDANHGHFDGSGSYHYHGSDQAPYMIGRMVGKVTEDATLQIIPQPRANPVRPSLTPLNGAVITDFVPNSSGNGYILTYERNGQSTKVDYSWTNTGKYTFQFVNNNGTTSENYNGHIPCVLQTSVDGLSTDEVQVLITPNPNSGTFSVRQENEKGVKWEQIEIIDLNGNVYFKKKNPGEKIDFSEIRSGVYLLKVYFQKSTKSYKFIVQ